MGIQGGGGGGGSASRGYDYNAQLQQAMQTIWGPQAQALQNMYGGVSGLMNQQAGQIGGAAQQAANQALPYSGLQQLAQYATPNNDLAQQQLSQYSQQVGQEFGRNIMPQLRTGAGIGGNMGGSREALAQGVAAGDASRAIAQGGTDLYAQQYGMGLQAAQALPGASAGYYNLAMQPYQAQWAPYTAAAGIFGGPTALQASQSFGLGENWNSQIGKPTKPSYGFQLF
jgi:hypothetical protein